jgi:hypothetical protein
MPIEGISLHIYVLLELNLVKNLSHGERSPFALGLLPYFRFYDSNDLEYIY